MGLIDQIKIDTAQITGNLDEFGVAITFTAPDTSTADITGFHVKHHTDFDGDGIAVNSTIASVAISEKFLTDLSYPVRIDGEVNFDGHRVLVADSTLSVKEYTILQWFPDETIGIIVCILGKYE